MMPRNGFPMIEGLGVNIEWDGPARVKRSYKDQKWAWWWSAKIRRNNTTPGLFLQPYWNPYFNMRVLGLFIGVGFCVSWPNREI